MFYNYSIHDLCAVLVLMQKILCQVFGGHRLRLPQDVLRRGRLSFAFCGELPDIGGRHVTPDGFNATPTQTRRGGKWDFGQISELNQAARFIGQ